MGYHSGEDRSVSVIRVYKIVNTGFIKFTQTLPSHIFSEWIQSSPFRVERSDLDSL